MSRVWSPASTAFLARRPTPPITDGFEVLVQLVIAAMTTQPSLSSLAVSRAWRPTAVAARPLTGPPSSASRPRASLPRLRPPRRGTLPRTLPHVGERHAVLRALRAREARHHLARSSSRSSVNSGLGVAVGRGTGPAPSCIARPGRRVAAAGEREVAAASARRPGRRRRSPRTPGTCWRAWRGRRPRARRARRRRTRRTSPPRRARAASP